MNVPPKPPGGGFPPKPPPGSPDSTRDLGRADPRDRLHVLDREIRNLRGPALIPSSPPPPISVEGVRGLLVLFAESAVHHVALGNFDEARRAIGEVVRLMPDVRDPVLVAKSSLYIGEALVGLDAPTHAKERLESAIKLLEQLGETRLVARAKIALGRAFTALEDPNSLDILMEAKQALMILNDAAGIIQVDTAIRELNAASSANAKIEVGYGRPVSGFPPPKK